MTTEEQIQAAFQWRTRNLPWYPRRGKRKQLAELFGTLEFREGVEVGTKDGLFAVEMCKANPHVHLTCVDPWSNYLNSSRSTQRRHDEHYARAVANLAGLNVTIMREMSVKAAPKFRAGRLDFVYIDGNHEFDYVIADILAWVPKVRSGGIVALHDYHHQVGCDVICAVDAYTRSHHIDPWYVTREELPTAFWVQR